MTLNNIEPAPADTDPAVETTAEPEITTEAPAETSKPEEQKKGCGSSLVTAALPIVLISLAGAYIGKKRR